MTVELHDPRYDPEPSDYREFRRSERLTAAWSYDVLRALSGSTWAPLLVGLFREGARVCGVVCAGYFGLRRGGPPRPRREPLLLDVRVPGYSHCPGWHFSPWVPAERQREFLRAYERETVRWLGPGCVGVAYRGVREYDLPLVDRPGVIVQSADTSGVMPITWSSPDEWMRSLRKSRRADLRRQSRIVAASDVRVEFGPGRADLDFTAVAKLHRAHVERKRARLDPRAPLPASYFATLFAHKDVIALSYEDPAGRLLAFGALLDHPVAPRIGTWAALRPEEGGRKHLYFDHYVRLIRHVIEAGGREELSAAQANFEVKRTLGFHPLLMYRVAVPRWRAGR
jgi:uncharacterized protein